MKKRDIFLRAYWDDLFDQNGISVNSKESLFEVPIMDPDRVDWDRKSSTNQREKERFGNKMGNGAGVLEPNVKG